NFNLRGAESGGDEEFVRQLGGMYTASVYVQHADTQTIARERKLSIQTAARELRYNWFHQLLQEQSVGERKSSTAYLLTAHHADDNIETVIMNFFRGTGIAGLRGILPKQGRIVRPLLPFRK